MITLAEQMAQRIRQSTAATAAATDNLGETIEGRKLYLAQVSKEFGKTYGVNLDRVLNLYVPKNDVVYQAAENGTPIRDFVTTIGSQFGLTPISSSNAESANWLSSENSGKIALAEFCSCDEEWDFSDGYAVTEMDGHAIVMTPHFDETTSSWEFSSYVTPISQEGFTNLSRAEKANVPAENRSFGDIENCAGVTYAAKAEPTALRM